MRKKKIVVLDDGRILDIYVVPEDHTFLYVNIYEVKRPDREFFFRHKFLSCYDKLYYWEDFETMDDMINDAISCKLADELYQKERRERYEKFFEERG